MLAAALDLAGRKFLVQSVGACAVLVGVGEGAHPVELGFADEVAEFFEFFFGLAGEADDERGAQGQVGDGAAHFRDRAQEDVGSAAALHALQHRGRGVLQRHVHVGADFFVLRDRVEQLAGDFVGIGVEKTHPAQIFDAGEFFEQQGQAIFQAEVFAVAGGVLADERDFADADCARRSASAMTDSKRRERNCPRNCGIMQNVQGWSQPSAILM